MFKLMLLLIIAGGETASVPVEPWHDTIEQCQRVGSEYLLTESGGGIVRGFACVNMKVEG